MTDPFLLWALWTKAPAPGGNLGYGPSVLQRILDGHGEILPGAPRGSGHKKLECDPVVPIVERFLATCTKAERRTLKVFYLADGTAAQKANDLDIPVRTMYYRVKSLRIKFSHYRGYDELLRDTLRAQG